MEKDIKAFRVFIASPSDVPEERAAIRDVVRRINGIYSRTTDLRIELLAWEDTLPGVGRPQSLINPYVDKADLFVGCLWKTLGSPSGNGNLTGFEEEFNRAKDRNSQEGAPEIWLFFKEIQTGGPPDPNLQKVLEFRTEQEKAKQLKFKQFTDASEWSRLIDDLLHEHMLRLATKSTVVGKEAQGTAAGQGQTTAAESQSTAPESQTKARTAFTSLGELLADAGKRVRSGKLAVLDKSETLSPAQSARLELFAAANYDWNVQHMQLGNHEINSVYWHRAELDLTALEKLFLLRTVLLDGSLHKPGWFWISGWKLKMEIWLPWFASHDSDETMRETVIDLATQIGYSLCRAKKKKERPIDRILADQHSVVRIAGLRHLAVVGQLADISLVERLQRDDDKEVRTQAEWTTRLIHFKANPDTEAKKSIERNEPFDDELINEVSRKRDKLNDNTLKLALKHPNGGLRALAAREILQRGNVAADLVRQMCADEAKAVRECGYLARVRSGETLKTSDIRTALKEQFLSLLSSQPAWNKSDPDKVVSECFDRISQEELWKQVDAFNEDSHLALAAIGRRFFKENAALIRAELRNDFQKRAQAAKPTQPKSLLEQALTRSYSVEDGSIETERKRLRVSALEILASNAVQDDREMMLKFLSTDWADIDQTMACLRGLLVVGQPDDRVKLDTLLSDSPPPVQTAAGRLYLALSPNAVVAAKDLLNQPSEIRVWVVVCHALQSKDSTLSPVLESLLDNDNENIRRFVCFYLTQTQSKSSLRKLLDRYLTHGPYFYNVVALLDRALYTPAEILDFYVREEKQFFERWRPSNRWQWDDLLLK